MVTERTATDRITSPRRPRQGELSRAARSFFRSKAATAGLIVFSIVVLIAAVAPLVAPYDPYETDFSSVLSRPSATHLFGTDQLGRDMFSRVLYGASIALRIGGVSILIALLFGVPLGSIAGFFSGTADNLIMRLMDSLLALPPLLLAMTLVVILGPNLNNTTLALGIVYIPRFARVARAAVISQCQTQYVEAARAIGRGELLILFLHVLPNCISTLIVQSTVEFPVALITAASLNYLGIGTSPSMPSWGLMLSRSRQFMADYPHVILFPALFLSLTVLSMNLIGDGLRDAFDVRGRTR